MRNHKWKKGDHVGFLGGSKTSIVHAVDGDTITIRNTDGTLEKIRGSSSYLIAKRNDIASQALPEHMIEDLRRNYETIDKIDPVQPTYVKLIGLLDKLPQSALKQLASAKIKFISNLARNRIVDPTKPKPSLLRQDLNRWRNERAGRTPEEERAHNAAASSLAAKQIRATQKSIDRRLNKANAEARGENAEFIRNLKATERFKKSLKKMNDGSMTGQSPFINTGKVRR